MKMRKVAWAIVKLVFSIVVLAVILMLIYRFALDSYDFGYRIFAEEPVSPAPGMTVSVAIVDGRSPRDVGEILEEKGLIRSATLFYIQELFSSYHGKLQPGIYELSTAMTPEEMMAIMAEHYEEESAASGGAVSGLSGTETDGEPQDNDHWYEDALGQDEPGEDGEAPADGEGL